jgi:hypothetical protein
MNQKAFNIERSVLKTQQVAKRQNEKQKDSRLIVLQTNNETSLQSNRLTSNDFPNYSQDRNAPRPIRNFQRGLVTSDALTLIKNKLRDSREFKGQAQPILNQVYKADLKSKQQKKGSLSSGQDYFT